jgi:hypothetical protein
MKQYFYKFGQIAGMSVFLFLFAAGAKAATLSLSPATQTVNVGDTLTVQVLLDTQGANIDGLDIQALNYNPYNLQLISAAAAGQPAQIQAGTLMPNTLANSVDTTNGKILFSQITNPGSTYSGSGVLATLNFKALVAGNTKLTFDFTPGGTTQSDVASQGNNILTSVVNGQYVINNSATTVTGNSGTPTSTSISLPTAASGGAESLIDDNGTFYLIINNVLHGITDPGMLTTYGFTFAMAEPATAADLALPQGNLLTPQDGSLVKSVQDPTVYLISGQQRYGFVSASVFTALGFKFSSVLVVTNPELQELPLASNLNNGSAQHLAGLDINRSGTIYWVGSDGQLHGYPSLAVYNSWHIPGDFSRVVPANAADNALPVGATVAARVLD